MIKTCKGGSGHPLPLPLKTTIHFIYINDNQNFRTMTFAATFKIPTYAVCYIEMGDAEGLDDNDIKLIEDFVRSNFPKGYVADWSKIDHPYFSSCPEFGKATDVVDADFYHL